MEILFNNPRVWVSNLTLLAMRLVIVILAVCATSAANCDTPLFLIRTVNDIIICSQERSPRGDTGHYKSKESENKESFHLKGP